MENYLLINMGVDELFCEMKKSINHKNLNKLKDIDILITRNYVKKISRNELDVLLDYNKYIVTFLTWFEWGGDYKWDDAIFISSKWKTILELNQLITQSESPNKAYMAVRSSSYGEKLIRDLFKNKIMKPSEIQKSLGIKNKQQVSKMLSNFERAGVIIREIHGKNVFVSLAVKGMLIYKEYFEIKEAKLGNIVKEALHAYEKKDYDDALGKLAAASKEIPNNPFIYCLRGIIALEKGELDESGAFIVRAINLGLDKTETYLIFFILERMHRLKLLNQELNKLNLQCEKVSEKVKSSLNLLGLIYEYHGDYSRAKEYYRLQYAAPSF